MMMKCQKCGFENQMGVIFCRSCGEKLDTSALSPENLDTGMAKTKKKNSWIGFISYIIGFLVIVILLYMFFAIPGDKEYVDGDSKAYPAKLTDLDRKKDFTIAPAEMTAFFNEKVLDQKKVKEDGEHVMFKIENSKLKILYYSKKAGLGTVTELIGTVSKGDDANPVVYTVEEASIGYMPASFMKDSIASSFDPWKKNTKVTEAFKNAKSVEIAEDGIKFTFAEGAAPVGDTPPVEKPAANQSKTAAGQQQSAVTSSNSTSNKASSSKSDSEKDKKKSSDKKKKKSSKKK